MYLTQHLLEQKLGRKHRKLDKNFKKFQGSTTKKSHFIVVILMETSQTKG